MASSRGRLALTTAVVAVPLATWLLLPFVPALRSLPEIELGGSRFPPSPLDFVRSTVGAEPDAADPPYITNVKIVDFDGDGGSDVLACDGKRNAVLLYRREGPDVPWRETVLADGLNVPAHATVVDLDRDGDSDVLVAVLGNVFPDDRRIGGVVLLENRDGAFVRHDLLTGVRRVTDVQPGDLDGDGDLDLAVAIFGFEHGRVLWLENEAEPGPPRFRPHDLLVTAGAIHVPIADYDGDGDLDIVTGVTQNDEEVWGLENQGDGLFSRRLLWKSFNYDLGGAGLVRTDLDQDGDPDLLLPVGDNFESDYTYPQPYHGCLWLENQGSWKFTPHRIATFGGTYAAAAGDIDADGDVDVALVSMFNEWRTPGNASMIWLENDGSQNFQPWQIASVPTHLVSVSCGDVDGDGRDDILAGALHFIAPYDRLGRIELWTSSGGAR